MQKIHKHTDAEDLPDRPALFSFVILREFIPTFVKIGTPKFWRWVVDMLPSKSLHKLRDMVDIMENTSNKILDNKNKALEEGGAIMDQIGQGKDIMSILPNLEASERDRLDDDEVLRQHIRLTYATRTRTLIFAATDTTSNALSRILWLLADDPEAQEKLRRELREVRDRNEDIPYDELVALPYLDAVCRETLRLYPPISVVSRKARNDIMIPLSTPLKGIDGRDIQEIVVPKNTVIMVSILNTNRDPAIWGPDAHEWKPERWLSPLPDTVINAHMPGVYSHLLVSSESFYSEL
ncbi:hypothetical protein H0H81_005254 [Sphagnurus paluster]|uniref:Cytochrome P450 n=1 Tax=Sphagnurus paluster TaxID=117069 RepID=A0A9P7FS15_9AGAR|nr:hypothetical protein H0H81_005254 [Sphagnurus paluster]